MTARRSNTANAYEGTLTVSMAATDLTAVVNTTSGAPATPCYLVIDPDDGTKREYVYFDGVFTSTTFVTSAIGNRYLTGSAAGSGITHALGAKVRCATTSELFTDLFDYIDSVKTALTTAGDIPYATGASTWSRLGIGSAGQVEGVNDAATAPQWKDTPPLLSFKQAVRVATTANGTLATAYANGQTVDGIVLVTGDRILLKNQTTGSENGIYTVNSAGAPTRAVDFDVAAKCKAGSLAMVQEGSTNGGTSWRLSNTGTVTPGVTAMTWAQFGAASAAVTGDSDQIVLPTQMFS